MNPTLQLILTILSVIVGVVMIVLILLQNSKSEGLDAYTGGNAAETFFGKNKGRSLDAKLQKMTVGTAIVFFLLTAVLALLS